MESDRIADNRAPVSVAGYQLQTQNMRVFDSVIGNLDRNSGNFLHDETGKIWLIDHSRSFPRDDTTRYLDRVQADDPDLRSAVRRERWLYRQPRWVPGRWHGRIRWLKKWMLRAGGSLPVPRVRRGS